MMFLFYIVCVILYLLHPCDLTMGVSSANLWNAFTYQFMHGSMLHLVINIFSLAVMYNPVFKIYSERFNFHRKFHFFVVTYISSVIAGVIAARVEPTVGASGMVYFLLGALITLRPTKQQLKNYIYVGIAFLLSLFIGNSNVLLHAVSFIFGVLYIIGVIIYDRRRIKDC